MKKVESLASRRGEKNIFVNSHNTVVLDEKFKEKFVDDDPGCSERFINMKALEAKWILTEPPGEDFLYALLDVKN